ncbi:MAG TPA: carboxypeptidase regulatory-like domain-containing protein [Bryobacteraceae bacterium]|nr:carboxypeptidase regulatory-like domain-containing protein [Bryobacteraceae bacterium]
MMKTKLVFSVLAGFSFLLMLSPSARAQSSISGQVRDSSGAVMAGVTVEAASPALIEKSRTVTTNSEGRYSIVDVRPGTYTMTFTMNGFSSVKQQVEVPANVAVPVDATMQVGSIGQTVEVQAQVATVDVENVAHPEVLSRSEMDSVPSARNLQSVGSYIPSVHLNTPDVGGSQQIQQTYMAAHGNPPQHDVILLDGMLVNTTQGDGQIQTYIENEMIQEFVYNTVSNPVESTAGGVYVNMTPKDGGNAMHGEFFGSYVPGQFVGSNLDANLIARGVSPKQAAITNLQDFDGSLGGPFIKDKLWYLLSGRKQATKQSSPLCLNNGSPCIDSSWIYTGNLRLTYQMNAKHKFSAMWMRDFKRAEDEAVTNTGSGVAANFNATTQRIPAMYYITQEKWSGTITPKLILDAGFSLDKLDYNVRYQNGQTQTPFSPLWYQDVLLQDTVKNLRYNVGTMQQIYNFDRYVVQGGGFYVTGSHQIKFGIQDSWGPAYQKTIMNGDLYAMEANGVPTTVTVYDTPVYNKPYLNADLGLYLMDTWKLKRLTITPGIRWDYLSNQINPASAPAGRFVPARNFGAITCDTYKGISCFKDWAPRLGIVYDVFGNHKTALKAGVGKYETPLVANNLQAFNPMFVQGQTRSWINTGGCTGPSCFPLDNQIGPAPAGAFGTLTPRSLDRNFHREYNMQYAIGVQHEIRQGLTLNFNWVRRDDYQQELIRNLSVPGSAWNPVTITNPLDGTPFTVYNLSPSYVGLTPVLYQTNAPRSLRANSYNGFETSVSGRLPHNAFLIAGWTIDHELSRQCDQTAESGNLLNDPNSLRYCDWYGNLYQDLGKASGIPFRNEFKVQGNVPLWYRFEFSASFVSDPVYNTNFNGGAIAPYSITNAETTFAGAQQGLKEVYWTINSSTKYPSNCACPTPGAVVDSGLAQGSETLVLVAPGSRLTPQLNQLDIGIRRDFVIHDRWTIKAQGQIFNVLNSNVVTAEAQTLGSSITPFTKGGIGGTPTTILNPRMLQLAVQFKF